MSKKIKHGRYEEPKTRVNMALTPSSIELLDNRATQIGVSRSELIEQFARGLLENLPPEEAMLLGESSAS